MERKSWNGNKTAFYLQKDIEPAVDEALEKYPYVFKSKSHLINSALSFFLRQRLKIEVMRNERGKPI